MSPCGDLCSTTHHSLPSDICESSRCSARPQSIQHQPPRVTGRPYYRLFGLREIKEVLIREESPGILSSPCRFINRRMQVGRSSQQASTFEEEIRVRTPQLAKSISTVQIALGVVSHDDGMTRYQQGNRILLRRSVQCARVADDVVQKKTLYK